MKNDELLSSATGAFLGMVKQRASPVSSALMLRATHGLKRVFTDISESPASSRDENWIGFPTQYGHIWYKLVSFNNMEINALNPSNVLQYISVMEPLISKLETMIGIYLQPDLIQPADLNKVGFRIRESELVVDIGLPPALIMKFDTSDEMHSVFDTLDAQINFTLDITAPSLNDDEIASLEAGDMILWPESQYDMLAHCEVVDEAGPLCWTMDVKLPELLSLCHSGNPNLTSFVRFQNISASSDIIMGKAHPIALPMMQRAQLFNAEHFIAWIYIIPFGENFAMLVDSINP